MHGTTGCLGTHHSASSLRDDGTDRGSAGDDGTCNGYNDDVRGGNHGSTEEPSADLMRDVRMTFGKISLERLRAPLDTQPLLALGQAVVGMESLQMLASLMEMLQPACVAALKASRATDGVGSATTVDAMRWEVLSSVPLMCKQVYRGISRSLLLSALEPVMSTIKNRSWTFKEMATHHSAYVDQLLQLVQQLNASLCGLAKLPRRVHAAVLEEAVQHISEQLVDAFSTIKKCNDDGRALMLRDVKVLQAALDNLVRREQLPRTAKLSLSHADTYVEALSLPVEQIVGWAAKLSREGNLSYSIKHLSAMVMSVGRSASVLKKKEQQEIVGELQHLCSQAYKTVDSSHT